MPNNIRIETLDGKTVHRDRCRAQRLVENGTHRWEGPRLVKEIVPEATKVESFRHYARFLLPVFDVSYPPNLRNLDPSFQSAMRYPVDLAKDQRSDFTDWGDWF